VIQYKVISSKYSKYSILPTVTITVIIISRRSSKLYGFWTTLYFQNCRATLHRQYLFVCLFLIHDNGAVICHSNTIVHSLLILGRKPVIEYRSQHFLCTVHFSVSEMTYDVSGGTLYHSEQSSWKRQKGQDYIKSCYVRRQSCNWQWPFVH